MLIHATLLMVGAAIHGPCWDETGHLSAGLSHWQTGRFDLYKVNPPLVRTVATAPLAARDVGIEWKWDPTISADRPEWVLASRIIKANGVESYWLFLVARLTSIIVFSLPALGIVWHWSHELFGIGGAALSGVCWTLSPLVVTNAQLFTPDIGAALACAGCCYLFYRWIRFPSWWMAFVVGVVLGLSLLTKFTLILLYGILPSLWLLSLAYVRRVEGSWKSRLCGELAQGAVMVATSLLVINVGYGFEGSGRPLGEMPFLSKTLRGSLDPGPSERFPTGNRFAGTVLADVPVPLPANVFLGIDRQKLDFERGFRSYLRGVWRDHGWWYYYAYGVLVKVPIGFLLVAGFSVALLMLQILKNHNAIAYLALLLPAVVIFVFVSSQTGFNHHVRYVLPAFPMIAVSIGVVAPRGGVVCGGGHRVPWLRWLVVVLVLWGGVESLRFYPHSHAYFNQFVGGPSGGPRHLLDSNVDWGQDLYLLEAWAEQHPDRPLNGIVHSLPEFLGVDSLTTLPADGVPKVRPSEIKQRIEARDDAEAWQDLLPPAGRYAVSVRRIYRTGQGYDYFRLLEADAKVGYTIRIYNIDRVARQRLRDIYEKRFASELASRPP